MLLLAGAWSGLSAQGVGGLRGRITDPSGAVVPQATVRIAAQPKGQSRTTKTDRDGVFQVSGLPPGRYTVTVSAAGFVVSTTKDIAITESRTPALEIHLAIPAQTEKVEVQGQAMHVDISPGNNASAVVISGENLDAFSNDPDEFQSQLIALAGPAVGPGGGEIYINGFTGGDMPPKSGIREIRVNSNPFSVQNDRLGYGRIDIFTKPGRRGVSRRRVSRIQRFEHERA